MIETRHQRIAEIIIRDSMLPREASMPSDAPTAPDSEPVVPEAASKLRFQVTHCPGGCISNAECFELEDGRKYFVKSLPATSNDSGMMFDAEVDGLVALHEANAIRTPNVILRDTIRFGSSLPDEEILVLEYLEASAAPSDFFDRFGRQLAAMHQPHSDATYGWNQDNFIGRSPQLNDASGVARADWPTFFSEMRIQPQLEMLRRSGRLTSQLERLTNRLCSRLSKLLATDQSVPSLLHGDLWSGNFLSDRDGHVAIFDPAVYYGHRECEFALPIMFGGFPNRFYDSYQESFPLESGWEERVEIYQLYHMLNHANLFGESYLGDCLRVLQKFA